MGVLANSILRNLALPSHSYPELTLIITGQNTIRIHKLVNDELARLLPKADRATIPNAGHGSARENPQAFNDAVIIFLDRQHELNMNASEWRMREGMPWVC